MGPTELADCFGEGTSSYGPAAELKVVETYDEPWDIPGTRLKRQPSKAVTVQVVMEYEEGNEKIKSVLETFTQHAFRVEGEWTWIVSPDVIDNLRSDFC